MECKIRSAQIFARVLLVYCLFIILWGAFVRISGSGDGCGTHWPLCQGYIIPRGEFLTSLATWIEYFHRIKSGLFGVLVFALVVWVFRSTNQGARERSLSLAILFFTMIEALIGAALVLFGWVDQNDSPARAVAMSLHLLNTFFLLGSIIRFDVLFGRNPSQKFQRIFYYWFALFFLLAMTGSWAALSNQLFPSESLREGFLQDFGADRHWVVQLRIIHPILTVIIFYFLLRFSLRISQLFEPKWVQIGFPSLVASAFAIGGLTLVSLSPLYMKLTHLLFSNLILIFFFYLMFIHSARSKSGQGYRNDLE